VSPADVVAAQSSPIGGVIQLSRLQKICHFQCKKVNATAKHLAAHADQRTQNIYWLPCHIGNGVQHCLASMDSELEAFSRNPTDGSFAALAFQKNLHPRYYLFSRLFI
jgi:hypothetical protein